MTRRGESLVKLVLRDKVYEVRAGMDLLSALKNCNIVPESVIATREGVMIVDDEILNEGEVIKLIAVISGGSCHCEGAARSNLMVQAGIALSERTLLTMTGGHYEV